MKWFLFGIGSGIFCSILLVAGVLLMGRGFSTYLVVMLGLALVILIIALRFIQKTHRIPTPTVYGTSAPTKTTTVPASTSAEHQDKNYFYRAIGTIGVVIGLVLGMGVFPFF